VAVNQWDFVEDLADFRQGGGVWSGHRRGGGGKIGGSDHKAKGANASSVTHIKRAPAIGADLARGQAAGHGGWASNDPAALMSAPVRALARPISAPPAFGLGH